MKVAGVDHVLSDNRTIIYFSAPHRVDFRSLVRDLGATLKGRVELRQLSARDEARIIGGIGSCGRELCCSTFLVDFEPVSVRMAKDQDLPLNPLRISGACGRLMCCLKYEHPLYQDARDSSWGPACHACGRGHRRRALGALGLGGGPDGCRRSQIQLRAGLGVFLTKAHDQFYGDGTVGWALPARMALSRCRRPRARRRVPWSIGWPVARSRARRTKGPVIGIRSLR